MGGVAPTAPEPDKDPTMSPPAPRGRGGSSPPPTRSDRELHIVALMAAATVCSMPASVLERADQFLDWLKKKEQR